VTTTITDITDRRALSHQQAMSLQAAELSRTVEMLGTLGEADWTAATECPDWDVHHMYLHVLGACEAGASVKENVHQMRAAKRHQKAHGGPLEAGLSSVQVRERDDLSPAQLLERLVGTAEVTVRKRTKMPAILRRLKMKIDGPVVERWTLGYLVDTIYLRDLWMHRVDTAEALGREVNLTPEHDGVIVADVVAEWARRHGRPCTIILGGSAGGSFTSTGTDGTGEPGDTIELDAVEFCRMLAGRIPAPAGPLETIVPF
jgi:uncharacterized protein (TIGR03083 family)